MPNMISPYSSSVIDRQSQQIRLVEVIPGPPRSRIECKFHSRALAAGTPFCALSYTWGSKEARKTIVLDGVRFKVRRNLWCFLHQVRARGAGELLWIDALCIDQSNVLERNHQVQFMGQIYSKVGTTSYGEAQRDFLCFCLKIGVDSIQADYVKVWLGQSYDDSGLAMRFLKEERWRGLDLEQLRSIWSSRLGDAILLLCCRPYWERIWVVQEILRAQDITLYCGEDEVEWSALQGLCDRLLDEIYTGLKYLPSSHLASLNLSLCTNLHSPENLGKASLLIRQRTIYSSGSRVGLAQLQSWHGQLECSNIMDKIYALLPLDDKYEGDYPIVVDYSKSAEELYRDTVLNIWDGKLTEEDWSEAWEQGYTTTTETYHRFWEKHCKMLRETLGIEESAPSSPWEVAFSYPVPRGRAALTKLKDRIGELLRESPEHQT